MTLYIIRFFTWGAWSILFTFFAVWLATSAPFSAADIAIIAGTVAMTNRAGALLFTRWIGRWDFRAVMIGMQVLLMAAIIWLQWLHLHQVYSLAAWLLGVALFGIANSVSTLTQLTFIASGHAEDDTVTAFSKENVALNLSAGITPYLSALVLAHLPDWYLAFALLYCLPTVALCMRITCAQQQPLTCNEPQARSPNGQSRGQFLAINFLSFFAFAQFYNVFPFYAEDSLGAETIGLFFVASSVLIVILQIPLTRLCARRNRRDLITAANLALAIGVYALLFATQKMTAMVAAILLLTLAEMIFGPLYQSMSIQLFPGRPAFAMAVLTFTWALAETAATTLGVYMVAQGHAAALFTLAAVAAALVVAIVWARGGYSTA
ncbi:MAG: MFS transporter [Janthinobacterium lividum]